MIKLYQFNPAWGLPNPSPFCMKVETYLRMVGLPYEVVNGAMPFKAPKKKLPYIEDGAQVVADSGFIVDYLKKTYGTSWIKISRPPREPQLIRCAERLKKASIGSVYIVGGSRTLSGSKHKGCFLVPCRRS